MLFNCSQPSCLEHAVLWVAYLSVQLMKLVRNTSIAKERDALSKRLYHLTHKLSLKSWFYRIQDAYSSSTGRHITSSPNIRKLLLSLADNIFEPFRYCFGKNLYATPKMGFLTQCSSTSPRESFFLRLDSLFGIRLVS